MTFGLCLFFLVVCFEILLYTFTANLACRLIAKDSEDSIKVASMTRIFSLDSIITAIIGKLISETEFAEHEDLIKFLYLALEADNRRYAIGNKNHGFVVVCCDGDNAGTLWNHGNALRSGIGNGIAIQNKASMTNRISRVIINDTYHLLRPKGKDEECEEE